MRETEEERYGVRRQLAVEEEPSVSEESESSESTVDSTSWILYRYLACSAKNLI